MTKTSARFRICSVLLSALVLTVALPGWGESDRPAPPDLSAAVIAEITPLEIATAEYDAATAPGGIVTAVPCPPVTVVAVAPPPVCPSPEAARGSLFVLYLWATALKADLRVGPLETSVDASFSDLLKDLDFAFAGYYEAWREKRGFYLDLMYVRLSNEEDLPLTSVDVTVQQTLAEAGLVFGGGTAIHGLDGIIGARYMSFRNELSFSPQGLSEAKSKGWVDPIIGGRYRTTFSPQWTGSLRADIGGFGIGSDFSWQILAMARYHWNAKNSLALGYRYLNVDYDASDFAFDGTMSGPVIGVAWQW